jgi:hypothetical protein
MKMGQTFGSQVFGPWYDIIGWVAGAAVFFYLYFAADTMPMNKKANMPAFLTNKKVCLGLGLLMSIFAIVKGLQNLS